VSLAVVGVPDERWGQTVACALVMRDGTTLEPAAMEDFAAKGLAHFKIPRNWLVLDSFPLTASGKIRKVELEKMFVADAPA
jgi:fatty-acyl-CoA synthase